MEHYARTYLELVYKRGMWLYVKIRLDDGKQFIQMTKNNLVRSLDNLNMLAKSNLICN